MVTLRNLLLFLIKIYQMAISPMFPRTCRFIPTCSAYAYSAILNHGIVKGGGFTLKRILRCHPFSKGGYDPVPLPHSKYSQL